MGPAKWGWEAARCVRQLVPWELPGGGEAERCDNMLWSMGARRRRALELAQQRGGERPPRFGSWERFIVVIDVDELTGTEDWAVLSLTREKCGQTVQAARDDHEAVDLCTRLSTKDATQEVYRTADRYGERTWWSQLPWHVQPHKHWHFFPRSFATSISLYHERQPLQSGPVASDDVLPQGTSL